MVYKAIIEEVVNNYRFRVRIPQINKLDTSVGATPTAELCIATVCTPTGCRQNFRVGDIVVVSLSEDTQQPVILGQLFCETNTSISDETLSSLVVNTNAILPTDTTIGVVSPQSIQCLQGVSDNIEIQLQRLRSKVEQLEKNYDSLEAFVRNQVN